MKKLILAAVTIGWSGLAVAEDYGKMTGEVPPLDAKGRITGDEIRPELRAEGDIYKTALSVDDQSFMRKATESGLSEVKLARLAMEKSKSDEVKGFAQRLYDDHTKANDEL